MLKLVVRHTTSNPNLPWLVHTPISLASPDAPSVPKPGSPDYMMALGTITMTVTADFVGNTARFYVYSTDGYKTNVNDRADGTMTYASANEPRGSLPRTGVETSVLPKVHDAEYARENNYLKNVDSGVQQSVI